MTLNFKHCTFSRLPGHAKWHWHHWWKPWHPPHWGGGKDDCDPVPCFTPGTRVYTPAGSVAVQDVRPGDHLLTRDSGMQQVVWVGRRTLSAVEIAADPALAPIRHPNHT